MSAEIAERGTRCRGFSLFSGIPPVFGRLLILSNSPQLAT